MAGRADPRGGAAADGRGVGPGGRGGAGGAGPRASAGRRAGRRRDPQSARAPARAGRSLRSRRAGPGAVLLDHQPPVIAALGKAPRTPSRSSAPDPSSVNRRAGRRGEAVDATSSAGRRAPRGRRLSGGRASPAHRASGAPGRIAAADRKCPTSRQTAEVRDRCSRRGGRPRPASRRRCPRGDGTPSAVRWRVSRPELVEEVDRRAPAVGGQRGSPARCPPRTVAIRAAVERHAEDLAITRLEGEPLQPVLEGALGRTVDRGPELGVDLGQSQATGRQRVAKLDALRKADAELAALVTVRAMSSRIVTAVVAEAEVRDVHVVPEDRHGADRRPAGGPPAASRRRRRAPCSRIAERRRPAGGRT